MTLTCRFAPWGGFFLQESAETQLRLEKSEVKDTCVLENKSAEY